MSFEFVHVTSEKPHQDAAASTRVRAHAMRSFRRRQERERSNARPSSSTRAKRSPRSSARTSPSQSSTTSLENEAEDLILEISDGAMNGIRQQVETYHSWILEYSTQESHRTENIANAPWWSSTSPIQVLALYMESIGHLEALNRLHSNSATAETARIKYQLLRLANERVRNLDTACFDETLLALAMLTSYEVRYFTSLSLQYTFIMAENIGADLLWIARSHHSPRWHSRSSKKSHRRWLPRFESSFNVPRDVSCGVVKLLLQKVFN